LALRLPSWEGKAYLALGSGNLTVKKCVGFQTRICETLTVVVVVIVVVVKKSIDNGKGSRCKSAAPFADTLIDLDKWVIRVLLRRKKVNTYKGKDGTLDCDYVRYLVSIDKVPNLLLDRYTFIVADSPSISIRVSTGQVLQVGRNEGAAPYARILTTRREVRVCIFLFTACHDTLGWWWCCMFKLDNRLAHNWSENIEINKFTLQN
jgi:hypothetical protein